MPHPDEKEIVNRGSLSVAYDAKRKLLYFNTTRTAGGRNCYEHRWITLTLAQMRHVVAKLQKEGIALP